MEREAVLESVSEENKNIKLFASEKLADIVVLYQYLGLYENNAVEAMQELAQRREGGDKFDYEIYITNQLNALPKIDFKIPQFSSLFNLIKTHLKL